MYVIKENICKIYFFLNVWNFHVIFRLNFYDIFRKCALSKVPQCIYKNDHCIHGQSK